MAKQYLDHPQLKSKCSFPVPSKTSFRDGKRSQDAILGFEYCEALTAEHAAVLRCRVYRLDPPIDMKKIGETSTTIDIWEGPLPFKAEEYETAFYHRHGAGSYKVIVEEQGLSGRVCDIWFTLPDREGFPPKIDDRTLCVDKPTAKDYIDWRFRRGDPVAGSEPAPNEGDDFFMEGSSGKPNPNSNATAAVLVQGFLGLADKQIDNAQKDADRAKDEAARLREQTQPNGSNPAQHAVNGAIDLAMSSASKVVDSVMSHAGARYDPPDPVKVATEILNILPKPDNTALTALMGSLDQANARLAAMQDNQIAALRADLNAMRNQPSTALTTQKSVGEQLLEMKTNAELLGYSRNGGTSNAAPAKSIMEEWGPIIQMGMTILGPLMQAITIKLTGSANGAPPIANGQQPQQPTQQAPPQQQPPPDPPGIQFLKRIEPIFMGHLVSPDSNGFTFANQIVTEGTGIETVAGRSNYNWIKQHFGFKPGSNQCGLDPLIRSYEPMWRVIEQNLPKYQLFLSEFLNYDEQVAPN
jgi:hypothetical protein